MFHGDISRRLARRIILVNYATSELVILRRTSRRITGSTRSPRIPVTERNDGEGLRRRICLTTSSATG